MQTITKHSAIQMALLLNAPGELRTYLVSIVNQAYGSKCSLDLETLVQRLELISKEHDGENLIALLHYIFCMRVENIDIGPN